MPSTRSVSVRVSAGNDATGLYEDPRLLGEVYVGPYVMLPGAIGFTAVDDDGPGGYVLAALDTRRFEERCEEEWVAALRPSSDPGPHPANPDEEVAALIHRPHAHRMRWSSNTPPTSTSTCSPVSRERVSAGLSWRVRADALDQRKVTGVHLDVAPGNRRAIGFYERLGFSRLTGHRGGVFMGLRLAEVGPPCHRVDRSLLDEGDGMDFNSILIGSEDPKRLIEYYTALFRAPCGRATSPAGSWGGG